MASENRPIQVIDAMGGSKEYSNLLSKRGCCRAAEITDHDIREEALKSIEAVTRETRSVGDIVSPEREREEKERDRQS